jgi:hypothetical protein
MNRDFLEMLSALSAAGAEFLLVGAHALAAHGYPRATGDLDIWVRPTVENAERVWQALVQFGCPLFDLTVTDLHNPDVVFQMGVPPCRIDIITEIDGVSFDEAWPNRLPIALGELTIFVIGRAELVRNKRAAGRPKDLLDVACLEKSKPR